MSLHAYVQHARAILNELHQLPTHQEMRTLFALGEALRGGGLWSTAEPEDFQLAMKFLGETPAQRLRRWDRLEWQTRAYLWLRTYDLAARSATTLQIAEHVGDVRGMTYRQAAQHAAQSSLPANLSPVPSDLWARWPEPDAPEP